jgi:acyl dehydratase
MPVDQSLVGRKGARGRIVVERSAVAAFARAVKDANPIYHDADAARAAGFAAIPAPPTFLIAAASAGSFRELQPDDDGGNPAAEVVADYARQGGLLLHGEQAFSFQRPVVVGDVLDQETEIVESYDKGSLTFTVMETRYTDAETGELVAVGRNNIINKR